MPTFEPPIGAYNPPVYPWAKEEAPFRYYRGTPKGKNLFVKPDGTVVENHDPGNAVTIYLGGHVYDITAEEAAILEAAGYTVDA
jgi:hypothetical protein